MGLQLSALQMVSTGKTFQEVVEFVKNVAGLSKMAMPKMLRRKLGRWVTSVVLLLGLQLPRDTLGILFSQLCRY